MHTFRKIQEIFTIAERKSALVLLGLMAIGMVLETLGISLLIPAITLLIQGDLAARYPIIVPMLTVLGNPSQQSMIVGGMLILIIVYFIKTLYLAFLAWWQTRFAFSIQKRLSQQLFTTYLSQPYTFHLQRNSAQLIRNALARWVYLPTKRSFLACCSLQKLWCSLASEVCCCWLNLWAR